MSATSATQKGDSAVIAQYQEQFQHLSTDAEPAFVASQRKVGFAHFAKAGFPTPQDEEWRFTNVRRIAARAFDASTPTTATDDAAIDRVLRQYAIAGAARLVFIDGMFDAKRSDTAPAGLGAGLASLRDTISHNTAAVEGRLYSQITPTSGAFGGLNAAFFHDGAFVHIPRGAEAQAVIQIIYIATRANRLISPRNVFIAEENAGATIVENYAATGDFDYLTNAVTEVITEPSGRIDHYKCQHESPSAFHIATLSSQQDRDSDFRSQSLAFGARLMRYDMNPTLAGPGANCDLHGLSLGDQQQLLDHHLRVEHAAPHCDSREYFKGIYQDASHGVFTGRIHVHQIAQKTDAKQTNMSLLLSDKAKVDTRPQLEIFADDVKCTHGATIGQLDADAMFYLRSRGIPAETARSLLVYAFASEVLADIRVDALRDMGRTWLLERLPDSDVLRGLEQS
ncbi:MAG: Fe-S cluster assembly protein SufD [Phycisphaerales bacterium]|nr:Fe-S cluster assembly protein SufD [Phycisphaerales bacterium]